MSIIEPQLLINAGLFIGGLCGGAYSALKIRSFKNGNGNRNGASIEKSKKTSGALHGYNQAHGYATRRMPTNS